MKKQEYNHPQERRMKFAEAGVLFVLVLALTIFIGVKVADRDGGEEFVAATVVTPATVAPEEAVTVIAADTEAEAEHPAELAADSLAAAAAAEPRIVTYAMAEKAYFAGRYDEAADLFNVYTDEHPTNAWGFYMLGLSQWKGGELAGASDAFTAALDLKPDHVKSLINHGRVLLALDRADEALAQVELARAADPASIDAVRVIGRIQHEQGRLDEAATSYLTVLRSREDDAWSLNNLGLIRIQQSRYEEALPALAKAVGIDPSVACFQNNLGVALERTGYYTAAGEAYAAALEADEGYAKADLSLARVSELTEAAGTMPVDLAVLADSFSVADDMEVAATDPVAETEFPVGDQSAPAREEDDTPQD